MAEARQAGGAVPIRPQPWDVIPLGDTSLQCHVAEERLEKENA